MYTRERSQTLSRHEKILMNDLDLILFYCLIEAKSLGQLLINCHSHPRRSDIVYECSPGWIVQQYSSEYKLKAHTLRYIEILLDCYACCRKEKGVLRQLRQFKFQGFEFIQTFDLKIPSKF